jgi:hypothetical protein
VIAPPIAKAIANGHLLIKPMKRILPSIKVLSIAAALSTLSIFSPIALPASALDLSLSPVGQRTTTQPGATTITFEDIKTGRLRRRASPPQALDPVVRLYQERNSQARVVANRQRSNRHIRIDSGAIVFRFVEPIEYFGLLLRNPQAFKQIQFFSQGEIITAFRRPMLFSALGARNLKHRPRYLNFLANRNSSAPLFDEVRILIRNRQKHGPGKLRIDNVAYAIPTPALLPGLIGLGWATLRKRQFMKQQDCFIPEEN